MSTAAPSGQVSMLNVLAVTAVTLKGPELGSPKFVK
jgi:hypothetical protein